MEDQRLFKIVVAVIAAMSMVWSFGIFIESGFGGEFSLREVLLSRLIPILLLLSIPILFSQQPTKTWAGKIYNWFLPISVVVVFVFGSAAADTKYQCYTESVLLYEYANNCYTLTSIDTNDPKLCQNYDTWESCHVHFAKQLGEEYICPQEFSNICSFALATEKGDASMCASLQHGYGSGPTRDSCYKSIAIKNNDPSLCARINAKPESEHSREYCYFELAVLNQDATLCDMAGRRRSECLTEGLGVEYYPPETSQ